MTRGPAIEGVERSDSGRRSLHGRGDLLAALGTRLDAAATGAGRLVLLSGDAGIGKTRLLQALEGAARDAGMRVWTAGAYPQDVELSGGLLLDLGHAMARADDPDVAGRGRALVADLADVVEDAAAGDAHRRRRLLVLDAVERVAALADEAPVLLALEDLHWCDDLSLEVVTHLTRQLARLPMLVVGTLRTDELHQAAPARAWRARLLLQRAAEEFRLPPLTAAESARMVRELRPVDPVPPRLLRLLHERSGGIPLHLEELVTAVAHGHPTVAAHVPETLADAIDQRFARVSEPTRRTAVAAAVVGRSFDLDLLVAVCGTTDEEAATRLDELVDHQFVHEEAPGWFGFRHALIRDAVEANAPLAARRALHARVAEVAQHRPELGGDAYRSAHHEAAGQLAEAVDAASAAAGRASALSAHQEALDLLDRAVRCLRVADPDRRADLLVRRAAEAAATDHNARAAADLEEARRLLAELGDTVAAAGLLPGLVAVRHVLGDPLPARIALLAGGLADVADRPGEVPQRVRAALLAGTAAAYLVADHLDEALTAADDALDAAGSQDEPVRLNTVVTAGTVEVFAGRDEPGWTRLEEATVRARELDLEAEAARGYRMLVSSASTLVEYDRAERWLDEGIEHTARTEQWNHRDYMLSHQAHVWWCTGRWDDAYVAAHRLLADDEGGVTTRIIALHAAGFVELGRGHHDAAAEVLGEARASGEEMRELQRFSPALWGLAESALLQGDGATAVELTERGYAASHEVRETANLFPFLVTGTRARLLQRDPSAAQDWAERVSADLLARGVPGTLPAVDHAAGLACLAAGRTGQARDLLGRAHAGWTQRRRWWEAQWCALDLARCGIAANRRTEAATHVEAVRAAAVEVGAAPLLAAAADVGSRLDRWDAPQPWSPLTQREYEVARLVARGMTNREIAEELRFTARTAGSHLEHIMAKLGVTRRAEVAAWATAVEAGDYDPASRSGSTR
ncbi:ATP-binding protein [Nocardioides iriomotensis]|uniref:ATP-binding protein n=1 Tax=Nocardioides iriomotensis TaxID=715784 RepID=UPI0013ECD717|nr:LuxR family transcriptional regulator [Nocardioides iriomotensis]